MSNLEIGNITKIVENGDVEGFMGRSSAASEFQASQELKKYGVDPGSAGQAGGGDTQEAAKTFSNVLRDSVDKVNIYQTQADHAIKELVAGRSKNIHETMLTIERADASLKLMMQVRNKILDAYREIMRMQV